MKKRKPESPHHSHDDTNKETAHLQSLESRIPEATHTHTELNTAEKLRIGS